MEWIVQRVFERGRPMTTHLRIARRSRGTLTVRQERDDSRHRHVMVARFAAQAGDKEVPPLYDVHLIEGGGDRWTLAGYERVFDGPLSDEHMFAQAWLLDVADVDDLMAAERKVNELSGQVHELRQQLLQRR